MTFKIVLILLQEKFDNARLQNPVLYEILLKRFREFPHHAVKGGDSHESELGGHTTEKQRSKKQFLQRKRILEKTINYL